jgi:Ni,Fe-hydrogenase III small subunit
MEACFLKLTIDINVELISTRSHTFDKQKVVRFIYRNPIPLKSLVIVGILTEQKAS